MAERSQNRSWAEPIAAPVTSSTARISDLSTVRGGGFQDVGALTVKFKNSGSLPAQTSRDTTGGR